MEPAEASVIPGMSLPFSLTELDQWVLWRYETRDGKLTKVPFTVRGTKASTTDPATWVSYKEAVAAWQAKSDQVRRCRLRLFTG